VPFLNSALLFLVSDKIVPGFTQRRIEDVSRKDFGKLASVEQYRSLKDSGAFHFPKLPNGIRLDTTDQSPAESAQLISEYLTTHKTPG
jgi:hypothetical protein